MMTFSKIRRRLGAHPLALVGPGVITADDDDPSGIATYSQAGAQFGLNMLWTMPVTYPMMSAVQSLCGRIGRVTGRGLAFNIRQIFPAPVLYGAVCLLLVANTFNISSDVAAMGDVLALMVGGNRHLLTADADAQDHQAKINQLQAIAVRYQDTVALFAALGGGWWDAPRDRRGADAANAPTAHAAR